MTLQEQKRMRDYFAKKISEKLIWTEADTEKALDLLDPVWPNSTPLEEAKHLSQRTLNFAKEFDEWQSKQPETEEKLPPMSDQELDALAAML